MEDSHFYITLPSNACQDIFPDNKTANYRVKLPQPLNLEGNWEVGMYSITYPYTWYTVGNENKDKTIPYILPNGRSSAVQVQYGYYKTPDKLVDAINAAFRQAGVPESDIKLEYKPVTRKIYFTIGGGYRLVLYFRWVRILGFGNKEYFDMNRSMESPYEVVLSVA